MTMDSRLRFVGSAPWLACTDLMATVDHYRDVLGFRGSWRWFWGEPPDHAGVSRGQTRICLFENAVRASSRRGLEVVIYVVGVADLYEELQGAGAEVVRDLGERPWGTLDFTVADPDEVQLIFTEAPIWSAEEREG